MGQRLYKGLSIWLSDLIVKSSPEQRSEGEKTARPRHVLQKGFQAEGTARTTSLRESMLVL